MEFKGTKGKWAIKLSESKLAFNVIGTVLGGKHKIARCPYIAEHDILESQYNAQLISKAPEILDMLQKLLDLCEHVELRGQTITEANNLIKQATTI